MAERQKRQQQIAPADAAVANGSERRSPLPGDRGDRGSKVTNSPQPACPPPARQINGRAQPARPAPFSERQPRALPGQRRADQALVGVFVPPPGPPGPPGPLFPPPLFALLDFAGFHLQTGNLTAARMAGGWGGGDKNGFTLCGLSSGQGPEFAPPPALPCPWVRVPEPENGSEKPGLSFLLLIPAP